MTCARGVLYDRSILGVHIQGAAAERGGAVGSRHPGARTGSDGSDEAARSKQMFTTSVYGLRAKEEVTQRAEVPKTAVLGHSGSAVMQDRRLRMGIPIR